MTKEEFEKKAVMFEAAEKENISEKNRPVFFAGYEKAVDDVSKTLTNRGKFIDWMIDNHLDIVKDYLGFNE